MRNFLSTLRIGRNTAMLLAAVGGLSYMASCSSDVEYSDQTTPESPTTKESYTVYGADQSRIHNFGSEGTRAAVDFTMPECPSESVYANLPTTEGLAQDQVDGKYPGQDMLIPANTTFGPFIASAKYYVAGTLDCSNGFWGIKGSPEIYVLPGGTFKMGGTLPTNLTVYNYGTIEIPNGLTISGNLYSATDIDANGSIGIDGSLMSKGSIVADKVRLNGSAAACAFIAEEQITFNGSGTFKASYFKAPFIEMNTGYVVLDNNGLMNADMIFCSNGDTRFSVDGTNAVIATRKFLTNDATWPKDIFADSGLALDFAYCGIGNQYSDVQKSANEFGLIISDENQPAYVPQGNCHPAYGVAPENPTATQIVKVAEIAPLDPEHDHGNISATCINFGANGIAYASYHLRGQGSKGCIEVIKDNGEAGLSLGSYMIAPDYDFNHIIVDGNRIVTVGNNTKGEDFKQGKGAFVGALPIDFDASESVRNDFEVKELTTDERIYGTEASIDRPGEMQAIGYKNAGDGNCIVKYGDKYYFTSYRGYGVINEDFSKVPGTFVATNGSAKHIAMGNGKTAVLAHDTFDKTSSTASVYTFGLPNGTFGDVLASYDAIGTIKPVDGKNVVAIDGDDIYACLSHGGLARIRGGQVETKTFGGTSTESTKYEGVPVNGLAIDANYLYVAAGAFVYVLEKESMKEVCHYYAEKEKSANYIALNNGKIYVAYGEDGIMAFELREKTIEE